MPERIQRKRSKDWRMPENTVYVGRPSKWGNPWHVETALKSGLFKAEAVPQVVVTEFEAWLTREASPNDEHLGYWFKPEMIAQKEYILSHLHELCGKNLACWCPVGQPCHADVLLRLANKACSGLADTSPKLASLAQPANR